jgi:predicted heme/steroid binding protein
MTKYFLLFFLLFSLLPCAAPPSFATPEYARETGLQCGDCHIDTAGGGSLTPAGSRYLADLKMKGIYRPLTTLQKMMRVIIGYIHLFTAIAWFGTILYVHILLKPAYAAKGLPKGELVLGWISIIVMAVTGTLLTIARMPSWKAFSTTRFGLLLSIKICLFLIMAATAAIVTFYIRPKMKEKMKKGGGEPTKEKHDFSIEELQAFNGREGAPAYVAFKGAVYDVTESRLWKGGSHLKKHSAGRDLTDILKTAPHGEEKILAMKRIGKIRPMAEEPRSFHERLFYFLAYMNLAIVFLIVFVIALMRWG